MPFLKPTLSIAERVDAVFLYMFVLSALFLVGITAVMVYFVFKYNRKRNPKPVDIEGNPWLEVTWTVVPLVLFLSMFYFGWTNFEYMRNVPRDAMVIEVTGRQWAWSFKYPDGRQTDEMYVALDRPVKIELHSADVLHGFYIAPFRVKADVVPGRTNYLWFTPTLLGTFDIQCTVICGVHHTYMLSKVHVLPEEEFKKWYFHDKNAPEAAPVQAAASSEPAAAAGLAVLQERECLVCHSVDGSPKVGTTFKGILGRTETVVEAGQERELVVDEAYLARAVRDPATHRVKGYPPNMPVLSLTDGEVEQVVAYLKALE